MWEELLVFNYKERKKLVRFGDKFLKCFNCWNELSRIIFNIGNKLKLFNNIKYI